MNLSDIYKHKDDTVCRAMIYKLVNCGKFIIMVPYKLTDDPFRKRRWRDGVFKPKRVAKALKIPKNHFKKLLNYKNSFDTKEEAKKALKKINYYLVLKGKWRKEE